MASEWMAARQGMMKVSYKLDGVQSQMGDLQKQLTGLEESMNRMEILVQRLVSSNLWQTGELKNLQDLGQPGDLDREMARRVDDLRQIVATGWEQDQLPNVSAPEGNFHSPSTGFSVVATGWDLDPLQPKDPRKLPEVVHLGDLEIPEIKDYQPRRVPGKEILEQEVYGINPYTHNLPKEIMPADIDWSSDDKQVRHLSGFGNTLIVYPLKPVIEEIQKYDLAQLYVVGRADKRLRCTGLFWKLPPWPNFCALSGDSFAQHCGYEVIESFYSVKQNNYNILDYIDKFEELIKIWPIMNEDYYARVEGREIISNLIKVTGLATMSAALRLGLDNIDEYVRNTIAWAFSVMASALDTSALLSFLKTVCQSKKSWQVRHTDIKVVQQTAILMGCIDLPHLKSLAEIFEHGLSDESPKVQTITALVEAVAPYGIESFNTVWKPPWKGIRSHLGKVLAAYLINEKLSIDEIKLTPLKLIELIASIKNGTIRGKIGMEKEGFTTILSIFRSVKCSEEVVDLNKTKTLNAIYDLGILIAKRLCQDHIKVSETQMVPLPTQLDAQVQNDQYENSVESDEQMRPWSENYFDPTTKNWTIQHTGSASCKRGFVQFCYEPIKQIIKTCMNDQKGKLWPMLQKLGMNLENFEPQMLDSYKRVIVSKNDTVILDRAEDKKSIEERAGQARSAIEQSTSDYDKEKLQERLAKLSGGVTVLNIEGVRLLAVKFVEKTVLMYTLDPNIPSDPPSEATEDMRFNVTWLRGGHPLLNVGDLAMGASWSLGLWLEQLKSLKVKSLSTSMIIVLVSSLSAIDQGNHSFYGRILPVLPSLDPASSIIKMQVPGAFHALKSAFTACLKCTHSSTEPWRARLWEAQNIINQGDLIEHTVNAARSFGDTSNRAESLLQMEASTDNSNKCSLAEDRNNMLEDGGHSSKGVRQSHDVQEHSEEARREMLSQLLLMSHLARPPLQDLGILKLLTSASVDDAAVIEDLLTKLETRSFPHSNRLVTQLYWGPEEQT